MKPHLCGCVCARVCCCDKEQVKLRESERESKRQKMLCVREKD